MKIAYDGQSISKLTKSISSRNKKLRTDIAYCAAMCVMHAVKHGNVTPATQLCDALGGGWRVNALRDWFVAFGPFMWDQEAKAFALDKTRQPAYKKEMKADEVKFASSLTEEPFWEFKPEPEYQGFDLKEVLGTVIKRAKKAQTDHGDDPKTHVNGLDKVVELHAAM